MHNEAGASQYNPDNRFAPPVDPSTAYLPRYLGVGRLWQALGGILTPSETPQTGGRPCSLHNGQTVPTVTLYGLSEILC